MRTSRSLARILATGMLVMGSLAAQAGEIRIAVASNFSAAIKEIEQAFEKRSNHDVNLMFGSTGKHYAQIRNGAPVDILLAADARRPRLLEEHGVAVRGTRFTYARGRLVLWSRDAELVDSAGEVLIKGEFRHLAIANPKLAPYGQAARQVLEALGLWERLGDRIVRGENVAQALQFVDSGNAELGFVAAAQLDEGRRIGGSVWDVPPGLYSPIEQQAVLLHDDPVAREFLTFLRSDAACDIIERNGYELP